MERKKVFDADFRRLRNAKSPSEKKAFGAISRRLNGRTFKKEGVARTLGRLVSPQIGCPFAHAMSRKSVGGRDPGMPLWACLRAFACNRQSACGLDRVADLRGLDRAA